MARFIELHPLQLSIGSILDLPSAFWSAQASSSALAMTYANQTTMSLQQLNMLRMWRYGRFEDSRVDRA